MKKSERRLQIGVLGCGPISQAAHFDASRKAHNADLYAICDRADDLREAMAAEHRPSVTYNDYDAMLADDQVEAVIIATADQFHVPLALKAIEAGKHVLVEKPLGVTLEECEQLAGRVRQSGLILQVGNNKRYDPGIAFARDFIRDEIGQHMALKAWYCDSTYRYSMTDNLQPIVLSSQQATRPAGDPKSNRRQYYMLTHGSHLVDMARYLGGDIVSVRAKLVERFGAYCWFISVDYADGSVGHLDLNVAIRGDWEEGFQVYGEFGSVKGKTYLPWFHKSSEVECFSTKDGQYRRPLGADAYTYKLQVEGFADTILNGAPQRGATINDGLAAMRAMVATVRSVESGEAVPLDAVQGGV
ncbi:MAG: Gfo/Idh/MocA family oxidoreductase [Anaerolineae bacterium]